MAKTKKNDLGAGLRALLGDMPKAPVASNGVNEIAIKQIELNPFQPRLDFDQEKLKELSESIKLHGIIQPLTVRSIGGQKYQLIAGERRLQAAKLAKMTKVPAYVRTADDQAMLEIALIENIQREDLNPMEIALSYQRLINECSLKHEEMADRVGKNRSTVSNYLRLLSLPPEIQKAVRANILSMGHARYLAGKSVEVQLLAFERIVAENLSVRQTETLIKKMMANAKTTVPTKKVKHKLPIHYQKVQDELATRFETKVSLKRNGKGKGQVVIEFTSDKDFNRILDLINNGE